ncbi:hypothetical protein NDU88_002810 [Pleurodeles waltl]|uniref:Uncharacterized protein n=1 Tax=Pleurodeles waltl TaxID=8319 RepID=A0AAV7VDX0_PLEWA|nr:hypothetical protein NDU88_002810 [Pleurodeles waltl]
MGPACVAVAPLSEQGPPGHSQEHVGSNLRFQSAPSTHSASAEHPGRGDESLRSECVYECWQQLNALLKVLGLEERSTHSSGAALFWVLREGPDQSTSFW